MTTAPPGSGRLSRGRPATGYRSDPVLNARPPWRRKAYRIIFEHDTPAGRAFDVLLIGAILASVAVVGSLMYFVEGGAALASPGDPR